MFRLFFATSFYFNKTNTWLQLSAKTGALLCFPHARAKKVVVTSKTEMVGHTLDCECCHNHGSYQFPLVELEN